MGILIAIDGVDASGKQTHTQLLYEKLTADGCRVRKLSFPAYECPSSALVKLYLSGEFGTHADDVNAYAASTFFAADRFATYRMDWKQDYDNGVVILADRYVSSNMIHQASKIENAEEKAKFLDWLYDLEYNIYGIPKPDTTIFLDMPVAYGAEFMKKRKNKIDGSQCKDIHEQDQVYLQKSHDNAVSIAVKYGWNTVDCVKDGAVRSLDKINADIYAIIKNSVLI